MERNYLRPDSFVELDFTAQEHMGIHSHSDIEFLFVISGRVAVRVEESLYQLNQGDMLLVNVNRNHSYSGSPELVMGRFLISYNKIRDFLKKSEVLFWCNSSGDVNSAYDELRRLIGRILNQFVYQSESNSLYLNSLYYQMLHLMAENFLLSADTQSYDTANGEEDDRLKKIFAYIRTNYSRNITLEDLADELYLSPTYVSKYIRKHCGMRFMELLTTVRLSHAVEDLLYLDSSIMKIALDNGFASVAACNKAFKDTYQMTPSEFRRERRTGKRELSAQEQERRERIARSVDEYLSQYPVKNEEDTVTEGLSLIFEANRAPVGKCCSHWLKMVNAGSASSLMNTKLCSQLLAHRDAMGFLYVRFWDLYAPEMHLDINAPHERQNYSRLDMVTDFLVENHLKPYIELGAKSLRIMRNMNNAVVDIKRELDFSSEAQMADFYGGLARHFVSRYGEDEVKGWYFEIWEKTQIGYESRLSYSSPQVSPQHHRAYFRLFNTIAGAIREIIPEAKIGGGGFVVRVYSQESFTEVLSMWKEERCHPDFISITCYPYSLEKIGSRYYEKRITDMDFMSQNISLARRAMEENGWGEKALHVSEYSFSLSNRNVLNDSCIKGAFLVSNMTAHFDLPAMAGHWMFSDIYSDEKDTGTVLFGGCGVLSKDGISKPSYYAFEFYKKLYEDVIFSHDYMLVTRGNNGSFRILCHNFKRPNYNYYISEEDEISVKNLPGILDDREFLTLKIEISQLAKGDWVIRRNRVNRQHGSVQDKWMALNMEPSLTVKELDYLEKASISEITITEQSSDNGSLRFEVVLEPNEIQYIDIRIKK